MNKLDFQASGGVGIFETQEITASVDCKMKSSSSPSLDVRARVLLLAVPLELDPVLVTVLPVGEGQPARKILGVGLRHEFLPCVICGLHPTPI